MPKYKVSAKINTRVGEFVGDVSAVLNTIQEAERKIEILKNEVLMDDNRGWFMESRYASFGIPNAIVVPSEVIKKSVITFSILEVND